MFGSNLVNMLEVNSLLAQQVAEKFCKPLQASYGFTSILYVRLSTESQMLAYANETMLNKLQNFDGNLADLVVFEPGFIRSMPTVKLWSETPEIVANTNEKINQFMQDLKFKSGLFLSYSHNAYKEIIFLGTDDRSEGFLDYLAASVIEIRLFCRRLAKDLSETLVRNESVSLVAPNNYSANYLKLNKFKKSQMELVRSAYPELAMLTERELNALLLIAQGMTSKEVAKVLNISFRTVEGHTDRIKCKLRCGSKSEIIAKYAELTILSAA